MGTMIHYQSDTVKNNETVGGMTIEDVRYHEAGHYVVAKRLNIPVIEIKATTELGHVIVGCEYKLDISQEGSIGILGRFVRLSDGILEADQCDIVVRFIKVLFAGHSTFFIQATEKPESRDATATYQFSDKDFWLINLLIPILERSLSCKGLWERLDKESKELVRQNWEEVESMVNQLSKAECITFSHSDHDGLEI